MLGCIVSKTHLLQLLNHNLHCLSEGLSSQPTCLQRVTEATSRLNGIIHSLAVIAQCPVRGHQCFTDVRTTHAGIRQRVPVHQANRTCGERLAHLVHRCVKLLNVRSRQSSSVSQTLNCRHRIWQINTSSGEFTNRVCHLTKVIDRQVRVVVQLT